MFKSLLIHRVKIERKETIPDGAGGFEVEWRVIKEDYRCRIYSRRYEEQWEVRELGESVLVTHSLIGEVEDLRAGDRLEILEGGSGKFLVVSVQMKFGLGNKPHHLEALLSVI